MGYVTSNDVMAVVNRINELVRTRKVDHIAVATISSPKDVMLNYGGELRFESGMIKALDALKGHIKASMDKSDPPVRDETLGPDYACFNLARGPIGFDFITWLVNAEMIRRRRKAAFPLRVGFWCGTDAPERMKLSGRQPWLDNVFRPALKFVGAIEDEAAIHGYHNESYITRPICEAAVRGEDVPVLSTPEDYWADGFVTITLREAEHYTHRNSNVPAWLRFAKDLQRQGEKVIIVRDTAKADEKIDGFLTAPDASRDLTYRMSLYQSAKVNLFVSNGPCGLGLYSGRPYLIFIRVENEGPNKAEFWKDILGVEVGGQFPWSRPDQRLVFKPDTYENIVEAWRALQIAPSARAA